MNWNGSLKTIDTRPSGRDIQKSQLGETMTDRKTVICPHCDKAFRIYKSRSPHRETAINYFLKNPDATTKEVAEKLSIHIRQAQYYKKAANEIKDSIVQIYSIYFPNSIRSEKQ